MCLSIVHPYIHVDPSGRYQRQVDMGCLVLNKVQGSYHEAMMHIFIQKKCESNAESNIESIIYLNNWAILGP